MAKIKELKQEEITERWSYLIEGAQGRGKEIFESVKKNVGRVEPPNIRLKEEMLTPRRTLAGMLRAQKREFLVASNEYLRGCRLSVGARDYGKQLMVSWYLISEPGSVLKLIMEWFISHKNISLGVFLAGFFSFFIIKSIFLSAILLLPFLGYVVFTCITSKKSVLPQMMDLFDLEELTAYTTTVHHAVLESVADVMKDLKQDPSKIDRKSRGFLSIS